MIHSVPRSQLKWWPLTIHLAITVAVVVVGVWLIPRWHVRAVLNNLTAPSQAQREVALNYVIRRAAQSQKVFETALLHLEVTDTTNFLQIVNALDHAGRWSRPLIPPSPWLRWLSILASDPGAESRLNASYHLSQVVDLAAEQGVHTLVKHLLSDKDDQVRADALLTAARLAGSLDDPSPYEAMIASCTTDPAPQVARRAWLLLGLLGPTTGTVANWRATPPEVAQAVLWSSLRTNPDQPSPAIEAINDPAVPASVRAMAAYCLHLSRTEESLTTLTGVIEAHGDHRSTDDKSDIVWRAILGYPDARHTPNPEQPTHQPRVSWPDKGDLNSPATQPLILSALYRGLLPAQPHITTLPPKQALNSQPIILASLAALEGLPSNRYTIALPPDVPDIIRLSAVAVAANPQPRDLIDLFVSDAPSLRDLACIVATDRFTGQQLADLVESLLTDFNDNAKRSGAILAGLTGCHSDLLTKRASDEDIWSVQQIQRLGLWMQGRLPEMDRLAPGLLSRDDLPTTTILLAMLHRGHPAAWEYLLDPRSPTFDLVDLLDQYRWWRVLERYLPDNAPPFWVWADPQLEQFQIEVLRSWYVLNSHRLGAR